MSLRGKGLGFGSICRGLKPLHGRKLPRRLGKVSETSNSPTGGNRRRIARSMDHLVALALTEFAHVRETTHHSGRAILRAITEAREWILAQPISSPKTSLIRIEPNPRTVGTTTIFTDAAWNPSMGDSGFGWIIDDLARHHTTQRARLWSPRPSWQKLWRFLPP